MSYPFRRTVTLSQDSSFHSAIPGSLGPVRVPMMNPSRELGSTYRDDELDAFKGSIHRQGYASCPDPHCRLSFLSLAGIVAHKKNCSGFLRQGEFVTCPICEARFCQFKSLRIHQDKSHGPAPAVGGGLLDEEKDKRSILPIQTSSRQEAMEEDECFETLHAKEELNTRLMAESRLLSNPCPRGRPRKNAELFSKETTNEGFRELDYAYYLRHSSRYTLLDSEPHRRLLSPSQIMKVRVEDGSIRYVKPVEQQQDQQHREEESSWSSASSVSGSARSARKTYSRQKRGTPLAPPPHHVVQGAPLRSPVDDDIYIHHNQQLADDEEEVKVEEDLPVGSPQEDQASRPSTSCDSKKDGFDEQRALLEAYEEIVLRSEALAESAKRKIKKKNDFLRKEKDLKSWEEELRRREAKAQQTINEALISLGSDSLDDCSKEGIVSPSNPTTVIDLCDDIEDTATNACYILPDSTRSVRSLGSSVSSSSIHEDNLSDSASLVASSLNKESISSPEPQSERRHHSEHHELSKNETMNSSNGLRKNSGTLVGTTTQTPRLVSKKKIGRSKRLKRGVVGSRSTSLQRQLKKFLSSIDPSSIRPRKSPTEESSLDSEESSRSNTPGNGIKVLKPVRVPTNAEPSNIKSTPSGVKYIVPGSLSARLSLNEDVSKASNDESEFVEGRVVKSRNDLISELTRSSPPDARNCSSSSPAPQCPVEVISSDLPNTSIRNNEDSSIVAVEEETRKEGEPMASSSLKKVLIEPTTSFIVDLNDYLIAVKEQSKQEINPEELTHHHDIFVQEVSVKYCNEEISTSDEQTRENTTPQLICSEEGEEEATLRAHPEELDVNIEPSLLSEEVSEGSQESSKEKHGQEIIIKDVKETTTPAPSRRGRKRKAPHVTPPSADVGSPTLRRSSRRMTTPARPPLDTPPPHFSTPKTRFKRTVTPKQNTPEPKLNNEKNTPGRKRARKVSPNSKGGDEVKSDKSNIPSSPIKKSDSKGSRSLIKCGKCDSSFSDSRQFGVHIASSHGGLAREEGKSQEFTPEEIDEALKLAFKAVKKVTCYKCGVSSFTTRPGLLYHTQRCGKTKTELFAETVPCPHCRYRGLPSGLKLHMKNHVEPPLKDTQLSTQDSPSLEVTPSGRARRSAAAKASKIMNETLSSLNEEEEDGGRAEDNDKSDEEFRVTDEVDLKGKFKRIKAKLFQCTICSAHESTRKAIISHIVSSHPEEDDDEYKEDEDDLLEDDEVFEPLEDEDSRSYSRSTPNQRRSLFKHRIANGPGKSGALSPCIEHLNNELQFRLANFCPPGKTLFDTMLCNDFQSVTNASELEPYLPASDSESVTFSCRKSLDKKFDDPTSLKRFEGRVVGGVPMFFAGGPIWTLEWAPQNGEGEEFFVVSAHKSMDDVSSMFSLDFGLGLIQIWSGGKILCSSSVPVGAPVFKYGLLHDYGKVWCLKWCPSGTSSHQQLGLLAAGCSNGNVYVHRMKRPDKKDHSPPSFYHHTPEVTLRPLKESFGQCLKLSWYNGSGHRVLGASYSQGKVALYDLLTQSSLLKKGSVIHPYRVLQVHFSAVNGIDLHGSGAFPRYLATGSFDRHFSIWDLEDASVPIVNGKKGLITDVHFFRSFPDGYVSISHDDVYLQSHTQTILSEPGYSRLRTQPVLCHNSAIKNEAVNFWLGTLGVGTAAGEVIVFVSPSNSTSLDTDKFTTRRRTLIYRTELNHRDPQVSSQEYSDCKENLQDFRFIDMNLEHFHKNPESEVNATRSADKLALEDITRYPLAAINRLSFNPNLRSCSWLLSGSQNGLGRLHNIRALQHSTFTQFLANYVKKFESAHQEE